MRRRLFLFGFGALVSIFFLSLGPENRLKDTFYSYIDYFDMDKRVITHLVNDSTSLSIKTQCQLVYYNISKENLLTVLDNGEVNFSLSDQDAKPCQYFVVEGVVGSNNLSVGFELCYNNNKSVKILGFVVNNEKEVCAY